MAGGIAPNNNNNYNNSSCCCSSEGAGLVGRVIRHRYVGRDCLPKSLGVSLRRYFSGEFRAVILCRWVRIRSVL